MIKDSKLISVIMPAYNREKQIKYSILSVLTQSYSNFELIIVDDGSTDNTIDVLKKIKDKRVKYYELEKNHGASYARNFGIDNAIGEYITFLDSDDYYSPDKLMLQLSYLQFVDADVVTCGMKLLTDPPEKMPNFLKEKQIFAGELLKTNLAGTPTIFAKKKVFSKIRFDTSLKTNNDWDLIISISLNFRLFMQDAFLVYYSKTLNSLSSTYNYDFDSINTIYKKYVKFFHEDKDAHSYILKKMGKRKYCLDERYFLYYLKAFLLSPNIKLLAMVFVMLTLPRTFFVRKIC